MLCPFLFNAVNKFNTSSLLDLFNAPVGNVTLVQYFYLCLLLKNSQTFKSLAVSYKNYMYILYIVTASSTETVTPVNTRLNKDIVSYSFVTHMFWSCLILSYLILIKANLLFLLFFYFFFNLTKINHIGYYF